MNRRFVVFALAIVFAASGCAGTSTAPPNRPTTQTASNRQSSTCAIHETHFGDTPGFAAVAYDLYGILLPGSPDAWHSECPSATPPFVYFGEVDLNDGALSVSLEDVGGPEMEPFDERAYLEIFSRMMISGRSDASVTERESLGIETLSNGHLAWYSRTVLVREDVTWQMIHGYTARPLANDRVLVAHVSRHARVLEPDTKSMIARALQAFGTFDELFDEAPADSAQR